MPTVLAQAMNCETGEMEEIEVEVPDFISIVPQTVTRRQAKLALYNAGKLSAAEAAVAAADMATKINWAEAGDFLRTDPLVIGIGATLGLTSNQIDDLFRAAAAL